MLGAWKLFFSLLNSWASFRSEKEYVWTHGKAFKVHQNSVYAVRLLGACELYVSLLNSWVSLQSKRNMSELMGKHLRYIRVLPTLWGCWLHVSYTLACWTHGWLVWSAGHMAELMGKHVESIRSCLRCEDGGAMWTTHLCQVNSWVVWWRKRAIAELMEKDTNPRVLLTLWRCWVHDSYTLFCWAHGFLFGLKKIMSELMGKHFSIHGSFASPLLHKATDQFSKLQLIRQAPNVFTAKT